MKTQLVLICLLVSIGLLMQYSAGEGDFSVFSLKQLARFSFGLILFAIAYLMTQQFWFSHSYILYTISILLLIAVALLGVIGMGAKRWLNIGFLQLQPSEIMRIALPLALARYFHGLTEQQINQIKILIPSLILIAIPVLFVLKQPDLGTAMILIVSSITVLFCAGVSIWKFIITGIGVLLSMPILWSFLYDYQKKRILIFLNPGQDSLNSGYHIIQSKIAIGSGGIWGKGFLQGTQSHLNFLPEKQTDFIFSMLSEEFGYIGCCILIALFIVLLISNFYIAYNSKSIFGRLSVIGLNTNLFCYIFINIGMTSGLLPVVGIPLPFVSYGGSALVTLMISQGLILSCQKFNKRKEKQKSIYC